ncbi:hypothetical protein PJ985_07405 [Streptomyces sp. ACA25]|uniref:hypothetical protein n=1 Tax=Streptomyces sp. ACA25 TaxID=3022596 RepID=UPI0023078485|nr:hypothetical protein [Streptomyces sp. ACA25]MDB1087389.1 hypothetical protein [Streptomyces sp. ACA25]
MSEPRPAAARPRHRFDPARLLLGLCLLLLAAGYAARSAGALDVSWYVLTAALPVVLLLTALVAVVTHAVRRGREDRPRGGPSRTP